MGLRFRKSISLFPGVKLNFGTTGISLSAGVPGFRKSFHTSGRVTTSISVPGTGIYYVDTKNTKTQSNRQTFSTQKNYSEEMASEIQSEQSISKRKSNYDMCDTYSPTQEHAVSTLKVPIKQVENITFQDVVQFDTISLKSIHKTSDDSIDWTEVLVSPLPPDNSYNQEMWQYYHSVASKVLSGDIDTYLQLIYEVNPLEDLLAYGGNYEFGTDDPSKIEVEFTVNERALASAKTQMSVSDYNNLMQGFICSVCIRIARDMFALLPVTHTIVHATLDGKTVISVDFDRANLSKIKLGYIDPCKALLSFKFHMNYSDELGFAPVANLE